MDCEGEQRAQQPIMRERICSINRPPDSMHPTPVCPKDSWQYGNPGGEACLGCRNLAHCPGGPLRPNDYRACRGEAVLLKHLMRRCPPAIASTCALPQRPQSALPSHHRQHLPAVAPAPSPLASASQASTPPSFS